MFLIEFNHLSTDRIITIYGIYLSLAIIFSIMAAKLIKRGDESLRKKFIIQLFLFLEIGLFLNALYAPIDNLLIQTIGNKTVIFLSTLGMGNLFLFIIGVKKSEVEFTPKHAIISELIMAVISAGYYAIPIEFGPTYAPIWPGLFLIYSIIITQTLFISSIVLGINMFRGMQDPLIRKKFIMFLIGLICIELVLIQTYLKNGQFVTSPLLNLMGLSIIPGGLLIYFGVGKDIKK